MSLRWKAFLLLLLVFGSLQVALIHQGYFARLEQTQRAGLADIASHERVFEGLLRHGIKGDEQRATHLAATLTATELRRSRRVQGLRSTAELFEDLLAVDYFDRRGRHLAGWSLEGSLEPGAIERAAAAAAVVGRRLEPMHYLRCGSACVQWVVVPAFDREGDEVVVSVAHPLQATLLAFREMTGTDVALLVAARREPVAAPLATIWRRDVLELTNAPRLLSVLGGVQARVPARSAGPMHVKVDGAEFRLSVRSLQPGPDGAEALFIHDETEERERFRADIATFVLFRVLVLLASAIAILLLLTPPMKRLAKVTAALPLLAEQRFGGALDLIAEATRTRGVRDEIDRLNEAARTLAGRLQELIGIEAASEAKSRFLASMSHELRTPLNAVIGFAELIADGKAGPVSAEQREYLDDILNSGRHLLTLINDVLDLAKVEAGRMDFRPETFAVATAVEEVCSVSRAIARRRGIDIRTSHAAEPREVTLDLQRFKQILYNLLSNAVKFSHDSGKVEVEIRAADGNRFQLRVRDHGIGIPAAKVPQLFGEFVQLDSGPGRRFGGTGLGLALTRRLVELQGGSIAVESKAGEGSLFIVELPQRIVA